jgi:hypothetical protein
MSILRRLTISAAITTVIVVAGSAAMFVTSAPRLVSLLVEPFSLLLMPGLVVAILIAGPHDFTPIGVVAIASAFYLAFFYWALTQLYKPRPTNHPRPSV